MKPSLRNLLAGLGTALFLAACGGGGGGGTAPATPSPTATASADKTTAQAGDTITLDGSGSSAPNGGTLRYQWTLAEKPANSNAALSDPSAAKPTFVADRPGNYVASLVVSDSANASTPANVTIQVTNPDPVAILPQEAYGVIGGPVQLDGSASLPPEGASASSLRYAWTITRRPDDSTAALDNPALVLPRFTPDKLGEYDIQLIVSHGSRASQPASLTVKVVQGNAIPVSAIAPVTGATRGQKITLDGSVSTDADKDPLQYRWRLYSKPLGDPDAVLENANTAKPSFTPKSAGAYGLELYVYDGKSRSGRAYLTLNVARPAGAANNKPVAGITTPWGGTSELELGKSWQLAHSMSYDLDGISSSSDWVRDWTLVSAPAGFNAATSLVFGTQGWDASSFTPTHEGNYTFRLRVRDPDGAWSDPVERTFTALTGANRAPTPVAKTATNNPTTLAGTTVLLDGTGSSDPDGNQLTYRWELIQRPDGSNATIKDASTAYPSIVTDVAGPYLATLVVTDSHGWPSGATEVVVMAKSSNNPPVVRLLAEAEYYTQEQPFLINEPVAGTQSWSPNPVPVVLGTAFGATAEAYDPDGDVLSYLWSLNQEPAGNNFRWALPPSIGSQANQCFNTSSGNGYSYRAIDWATFEDFQSSVLNAREWTCPGVLLAPTAQGTYNLELLVSDGTDIVGPFRTSVPAVLRHNYPTLLLENLHRQHRWSNNDQYVTLQQVQQHPTHVLFPFNKAWSDTIWNSNAIERLPANLGIVDSGGGLINGPYKGDLVVKTLRLTAFGGNYTITDLQAFDKDGVEKPKFTGLANGQVIQQGQNAEFQLVWPITTSPQAGEGFNTYKNKNGMVWSFKIAEKPGFIFYYNPGSPQ